MKQYKYANIEAVLKDMGTSAYSDTYNLQINEKNEGCVLCQNF